MESLAKTRSFAEGISLCTLCVRVKSGIFGQTAKFGQRPCLFHISNIGIKNKLTTQTVKILMRRLIRSRLFLINIVCKYVSEFYLMSEFTRLYPILLYFVLGPRFVII